MANNSNNLDRKYSSVAWEAPASDGSQIWRQGSKSVSKPAFSATPEKNQKQIGVTAADVWFHLGLTPLDMSLLAASQPDKVKALLGAVKAGVARDQMLRERGATSTPPRWSERNRILKKLGLLEWAKSPEEAKIRYIDWQLVQVELALQVAEAYEQPALRVRRGELLRARYRRQKPGFSEAGEYARLEAEMQKIDAEIARLKAADQKVHESESWNPFVLDKETQTTTWGKSNRSKFETDWAISEQSKRRAGLKKKLGYEQTGKIGEEIELTEMAPVPSEQERSKLALKSGTTAALSSVGSFVTRAGVGLWNNNPAAWMQNGVDAVLNPAEDKLRALVGLSAKDRRSDFGVQKQLLAGADWLDGTAMEARAEAEAFGVKGPAVVTEVGVQCALFYLPMTGVARMGAGLGQAAGLGKTAGQMAALGSFGLYGSTGRGYKEKAATAIPMALMPGIYRLLKPLPLPASLTGVFGTNFISSYTLTADFEGAFALLAEGKVAEAARLIQETGDGTRASVNGTMALILYTPGAVQQRDQARARAAEQLKAAWAQPQNQKAPVFEPVAEAHDVIKVDSKATLITPKAASASAADGKSLMPSSQPTRLMPNHITQGGLKPGQTVVVPTAKGQQLMAVGKVDAQGRPAMVNGRPDVTSLGSAAKNVTPQSSASNSQGAAQASTAAASNGSTSVPGAAPTQAATASVFPEAPQVQAPKLLPPYVGTPSNPRVAVVPPKNPAQGTEPPDYSLPSPEDHPPIPKANPVPQPNTNPNILPIALPKTGTDGLPLFVEPLSPVTGAGTKPGRAVPFEASVGNQADDNGVSLPGSTAGSPNSSASPSQGAPNGGASQRDQTNPSTAEEVRKDWERFLWKGFGNPLRSFGRSDLLTLRAKWLGKRGYDGVDLEFPIDIPEGSGWFKIPYKIEGDKITFMRGSFGWHFQQDGKSYYVVLEIWPDGWRYNTVDLDMNIKAADGSTDSQRLKDSVVTHKLDERLAEIFLQQIVQKVTAEARALGLTPVLDLGKGR